MNWLGKDKHEPLISELRFEYNPVYLFRCLNLFITSPSSLTKLGREKEDQGRAVCV